MSMLAHTRAFRIGVRITLVAVACVLAIVVLHQALVSAIIGGITVAAVMLDALLQAEVPPAPAPAEPETLTVDLRRRP